MRGVVDWARLGFYRIVREKRGGRRETQATAPALQFPVTNYTKASPCIIYGLRVSV